MKIWLDAQLSPKIAQWMEGAFDLVEEALPVQLDPSLRASKDRDIFEGARTAGVVVMTKDRDFVDLLARHGPPPQVLWITCGNTSNRVLRGILSAALSGALNLLRHGEPLVEITDLE